MRLILPILLILSFVFIGAFYTTPELSNDRTPVDTVFVDKTDTIVVSSILKDSTLYERSDTIIVVIKEDIRDTAFVSNIVYVDSLVGEYGRNETNLNHNITRTHRQDSLGTHYVTYSWNSDATFNDINWTCLEYTEPDPPTTTTGQARVLLRNSITLPYTATEEYEVTIGQDCQYRLYVYIWSQDSNWSIRYDDYLDLGEMNTVN